MKYHLLHLFIFTLLISCTSDQETLVENTPVNNKAWLGEWERQDRLNEATLTIENIVNDTIFFTMVASSGGHTGEIEGHAVIKDEQGLFSEGIGEDNCTLEFQISGDSIITVNQKEGDCFTGVGVTYSGRYKNSKFIKNIPREKTDLVRLGVLENYHQDSVFRKLVGEYYDAFLNSTQLTSEDTDLDHLNTRVVSSGVRGLFTYMENIVMMDSADNIWAAVINDKKILYFTNRSDFTRKLPNTIIQWKENFKDYEVVIPSQQNDDLNPTGTYLLDEKTKIEDGETYGYFGKIQVVAIQKNKIAMTFYICKGAPSYNSGSFIDTLDYIDNKALHRDEDLNDCLTEFTFNKNSITVIEKKENRGCWGNGVQAHGIYQQSSSKPPLLMHPLSGEIIK